MDRMLAMQILAGACGLVLAVIFLRRKMPFFLEFLLRTGVGAVSILWLNSLMIQQGITANVGLNFWSLLTSGTLGIPGVVLLFAISALAIL